MVLRLEEPRYNVLSFADSELSGVPLMVLILGSEADPHVQRVCDSLSASGTPHSIIFTRDFPVLDHASIEIGSPSPSRSYCAGGRTIPLDAVRVVWYRRYFAPTLSDAITDPIARRYGTGESSAFLIGLWRGVLSDRIWVNPYDSNQRSESKLLQLSAAERVGLSIPKTLCSNDPIAVTSFFDNSEGRIIYKPLAAFATSPSGDSIASRCVYTNIVTRDQLDQLMPQIALAPCLFQAYVAKQLELRITVIGDTFLTAAIDSQSSPRTMIDWRHYDLENTNHIAYDLPAPHRKKLRRLLDDLGLVYGAIDCIIRPDGEMVFLEVNPGGQWLWIEELTGLGIGQAIGEYLTMRWKAA